MNVLKRRGVAVLVLGIIATAVAIFGRPATAQPQRVQSTSDHLASITIDYPLEGSIFPPEITPPTFIWHDASHHAARWHIAVAFADGSAPVRVVSAGGQARQMRWNTPLMNSWHSFSPNGRWLVFSSKSRSPYTRMFLSRLDDQGNDSPAIMIDNATAANRAVNIPEFVNIPQDGMIAIATPAVDMYKEFDHAADLAEKDEYEAVNGRFWIGSTTEIHPAAKLDNVLAMWDEIEKYVYYE